MIVKMTELQKKMALMVMLKSELLGFTEIEGNHGGANIASVILHVIDRYDIRDKVNSFGACLFDQFNRTIH